MATKRCCCVVPPPCVPCAEKENLATWAVYESILGFVLSGEFGPLAISGCNKTGYACDREDNIEVGEVATSSPWSAWVALYSCGACINCETNERPPPCIDDPFTGEIVCPPGYPTYKVVERQSRTGTREKIWYSKGVELCVTAQYIGSDSIKFTATLRYLMQGATTASFATKRRWRRRELECVSNRVIDPGTPNTDDSFGAPSPLPPCVDLLGDVGRYCPPYEPPVAPDPCETSDTITIVDDPCEKLISVGIDGVDCIFVREAVQLTINSSRNCCDEGLLCGSGFAAATISYESEVFLCSEVPASISLTAIGGPPADAVLGFFCEEGITAPADVVFPIPEVLTLTVANSP